MADKPVRNPQGDPAQLYENYSPELKGWDAEGREVWHHTYYDPERNSRISYDTVKSGYLNEYLRGTGHEVNQNTGKITRWESASERSWQDYVVRRN